MIKEIRGGVRPDGMYAGGLGGRYTVILSEHLRRSVFIFIPKEICKIQPRRKNSHLQGLERANPGIREDTR